MDFTIESRLKNIQTFDLIGFHGRECVSYWIVDLQHMAIGGDSKLSKPKISHIGLALRGEDLNKFTESTLSILKHRIRDTDIYVFESTLTGKHVGGVMDIFGNYFFGAQIRLLRDVVAHYSGKIFWSPRKFEMTEFHLSKMAESIQTYHYMPYEKSIKIMLANVFRCLNVIERTEKVFCSELVAKCLQMATILPDSINPEMVVPLDFYVDPENPDRTMDVDGEIPILFESPIPLK